MPNKLIGLSMRIGGAILCGMLLNKFPVENINYCDCLIAFLLHVVVCLFATITDHSDDHNNSHVFIKTALKISPVVIVLILCIISMTLGHLICAVGMFSISLLFVCISVYL